MKKEFKLIVTGLCVILVSIGIVFWGLYRYMDTQTEKDVREIGRVFLQEKAHQEAKRFEAIKTIRFSQMDSMKEELDEAGPSADAETLRSVLSYSASFQDLANCSLISASGGMETIYGEPIERLGDEPFLLERLGESDETIVTGGWSESRQLIIYASPLSVPMENGEESIGLLWCKPISFFINMMNLNDPQSLVYFHIIRRDTSFVIEDDTTEEDTYDDLVKAHVMPEGMSAEEFIDRLHEAIRENDVFTMHTRYVNEDQGVNVRRSVYAMPLADSNWYLLCILPYGVLDKTITAMGQARTQGMLIGLGILASVLLVVFLLYIRMTGRQIAKLEEARAEAVSASQAKSEFLSNMSHDIRTPMNAIVGMTAIARDHLDDQERVDDCLKKISLSGKQLLGLINDVLDMSKIESGKMTLKMEALSLKQTMETMCEIVRPQIKANGQQFDIVINSILSEEVYCDSVRLNQVLLNFLSNAMKFTPAGGSIEISLWQEPSEKGDGYVRTHFSVNDTGMGMTEEFKKKLFTAFEREDNQRVQKTQGTGLGMAITKFIVDAMGGTIDVESEAGVGSSFHVTIDLEKVPAGKDQMKLPDWRILVVDDNEDVCRTTALSLGELGCRPQTIGSGEEAVEMAVRARDEGEGFFAVLIDYKLRGMNGIETAKKIHERIGEDVPISIISAYDWSDIEEEAYKAGIRGFISKPLFKSTLFYSLRDYQEAEKHEEMPAPKAETDDISGMRILLAEDNDLNAEIAAMILEESGCTVEHAEDGRIAKQLFEKSELWYYDAVLMDLRMPNMNGIEAAEAIRSMKRPDAAKIPIIAMTADAFAEDAQKCRAAGMNAHLAKPIDIDQLKYTLAHFVKMTRS